MKEKQYRINKSIYSIEDSQWINNTYTCLVDHDL